MGRRILVCEDDVETRTVLGAFLRQTSTHVIEVSTGNDALALIKDGTVICAFLELAMQSTDAFALARAIRALHLPVRPRLVAITERVSSLNIERSRAAGFDLQLVKPIDRPRVLAVLSTLRIPQHE